MRRQHRMTPRLLSAVSPVAVAVAALAPITAMAGPQGAEVRRGGVVISAEGQVTTIDQSTDRAVIEWQAFDVGRDEAVRFNQPAASSVTLNRVRGGAPSDIAGEVSANGQVWILNRHGVMIHDTARINVGGLVASTADIPDDAFMAGSNRLSIPGEPGAQVINEGRISFGDQGLVGLIGPHAENRGEIVGRLGTVVIGGVESLAIDLAGDGLIAFEVAPEVFGAEAQSLVASGGTIRNDGGLVAISALAAGELVDSVVSVEGLVATDTLRRADGSDTAGAIAVDGGRVSIGGTLTARAPVPRQDAGRVAVRGRAVTVAETGRIDASATGTGGRVDVIGRETGDFAGVISVAGDARGGFVDTSAPDLRVSGSVEASAGPGGIPGSWLIDPVDFVIGETLGDGVNIRAGAIRDALSDGTDVTLNTETPGTVTGVDADTPGAGDDDPAIPNFDDFEEGAGTITVLNGLTEIEIGDGLSATLTFIADSDIVFDSASGGLTQTGAGVLSVAFTAGNAIAMRSGDGALQPIAVGGTVAMTAGEAIAVGQVTTTAGLGEDEVRPIVLDAPDLLIDSDVALFNGTGLGFAGLLLAGGMADVRSPEITRFGDAALEGITQLTLRNPPGETALRLGNVDLIGNEPVLNVEADSLSDVTDLTVIAEGGGAVFATSAARSDLDLSIEALGGATGTVAQQTGASVVLGALQIDATGDIAIGVEVIPEFDPGDTTGLEITEALDLRTDGEILVAAGVDPGRIAVGTQVTLEAADFAIAPLTFGGAFDTLDVTRTGLGAFALGADAFDLGGFKNTGLPPIDVARLAAREGGEARPIVVRGVDTVAPTAGAPITTVLLDGEAVSFVDGASAFNNLALVTETGVESGVGVSVGNTLALRVDESVDLSEADSAFGTVTGVVDGDLSLASATAMRVETLRVGGTAILDSLGALTIDTLTLGSGPAPGNPLPDPAANSLTATAAAITAEDLVAGDTSLTLRDTGNSLRLDGFDVADLTMAGETAAVEIDRIDLLSGIVRGSYDSVPLPEVLSLRGVRFDAAAPIDLAASAEADLDRVVSAGDLAVSAPGVRLGRLIVGGMFEASAGADHLMKLPDTDLTAAPAAVAVAAVDPADVPGLTLSAPLTAPGTGSRDASSQSFEALLDLAGSSVLRATEGGDVLLPSALGGPSGPLHNRFAGAVDAEGADIAIAAAGALTLGRVVASGDLAVRSNAGGDADGSGGIAQTAGTAPDAGIDVTGDAAFITGRHGAALDETQLADVLLDNAANRFAGSLGLIARTGAVASADPLALADSRTSGSLTLTTTATDPIDDTALRLRDSAIGGGLRLTVPEGSVAMERIAIDGAIVVDTEDGPVSRGLSANRMGGSFTASDLAAGGAGLLVVDAEGDITLGRFLHSGFDLSSGSSVTLREGAGDGDGRIDAATVTIDGLRSGGLSVDTPGDIVADGVLVGGDAVLDADGAIELGTIRTTGTMQLTAGTTVETMTGTTAVDFTVAGVTAFDPGASPALTLGFDVAGRIGDPVADTGTRLRETGLDGRADAEEAFTFDGLVVADGAARIEAGGDGIALLRREGLASRFEDTLALYAPRIDLGAPSTVIVEAGRASGAPDTPLTFGRFPGESVRDTAVLVATGTLSVRNDGAIRDDDTAPAPIVVGGAAGFAAQDWDDTAAFSDIALDGRDLHRFAGPVALDGRGVYLDADGFLAPGAPTGAPPPLRLGPVQARAESGGGLAFDAVDPALRRDDPTQPDIDAAENRTLVIRSGTAIEQEDGAAIALAAGSGPVAPLAEISAARTDLTDPDAPLTDTFDLTLDSAANLFGRLSMVGRAVTITDAGDLTLERSAATDRLQIAAGGELTLDAVRVGGEAPLDAPVAANALVAEATSMMGRDIDAGDVTLRLGSTDGTLALERFRSAGLTVETDPAGEALTAMTLRDGRIGGPSSLAPADTVILRNLDIASGDALVIGGTIHADGLRVDGALELAAEDTLRLGRIAAGALDGSAGSGGIAKLADADLTPLASVALGRIAVQEPSGPLDGRATASLDLPLHVFDALIYVDGTTALSTTADILLPSALGGPSGPLHNRFGGAIDATGADIALESAGALVLGRLVASGDLALRSNAANESGGAGGITQTMGGAPEAGLAVGGDAAFITGRHGADVEAAALADIVLDNPANRIAGSLGLLARDATIASAGSLDMTSAWTAGDLSVSADDLALADSRIAGTLALRTTQDATLDRVLVAGSGGVVAGIDGAVAARDLAATGGGLTVTAESIDLDRWVAHGGLDLDTARAISLRRGVQTGSADSRLYAGGNAAGTAIGLDGVGFDGPLTLLATAAPNLAIDIDALRTEGPLTLNASGDIRLGTLFAAQTLRADAGGAIATQDGATAPIAIGMAGPDAAAIGLLTGPRIAQRDAPTFTDPADSRVTEPGRSEAGESLALPGFDGLVVAQGAARFASGADGLTLVSRMTRDTAGDVLLNRFEGPLSLTAPGATTVEAAGDMLLGRFANEGGAAVAIGAGVLTLQAGIDGAAATITQSAPVEVAGVARLRTGPVSGVPLDGLTGAVILEDSANRLDVVEVESGTTHLRATGPTRLRDSRLAGAARVEIDGALDVEAVTTGGALGLTADAIAATQVDADRLETETTGEQTLRDVAVAGDAILRRLPGEAPGTITLADASIGGALTTADGGSGPAAGDLRLDAVSVGSTARLDAIGALTGTDIAVAGDLLTQTGSTNLARLDVDGDAVLRMPPGEAPGAIALAGARIGGTLTTADGGSGPAAGDLRLDAVSVGSTARLDATGALTGTDIAVAGDLLTQTGSTNLARLDVDGDAVLSTSQDMILAGVRTPDVMELDAGGSIAARTLRAGRLTARAASTLSIADITTAFTPAQGFGDVSLQAGGDIAVTALTLPERAILDLPGDLDGMAAPSRTIAVASLSPLDLRVGTGRAAALGIDADGNDLRFLGVTGANGRLGAVTVTRVDNLAIGLELTADRGEITLLLDRTRTDDMFFAESLAIDGFTGFVRTLRDEATDIFWENATNTFFGVNLTGNLTFANPAPGAELDLTGALGPDGLRSRAAGLRPGGPRGAEFIFNGCIIGDAASCGAIPSVLSVIQFRFDPPSLFDLDLTSLADVYASFGNEEFWALTPGFLVDIDDDFEEDPAP